MSKTKVHNLFIIVFIVILIIRGDVSAMSGTRIRRHDSPPSSVKKDINIIDARLW